MKLYLEIDIRPYLRMWKSKDNGNSNKKVMKKFYELFAQPSYKHLVWSSSLATKRLNFLCMCGQCQRQTTWLSQTWILSILQKQKQHVSVMGSNTWLNMGLMPFHMYAYNGVRLWYISLPVKWQEQSNCSCLCIHAGQMITLLWFCKIYVSIVYL